MPAADHLGGVCVGHSAFLGVSTKSSRSGLPVESQMHRGYILIVSTTMKSLITIALLLLAPSLSSAQFGSANHAVTVQVSAITVIQVSAGSVNLNIAGSSAVAGQDQMSVSDESTTLLWGTNSSGRKITVNSSLATPTFTLKALAVNPTQGSPAAEASLTSTPVDFMLNIGRSLGSCLIRYTGIALASQGTGTDSHTITFTIQAQ